VNGTHDLGGMDGFGPINPESDEPLFHADWERRVFGMLAPHLVQRISNLDEFRHGVERMGSIKYLTTSYYEHWLAAMETRVVETGAVSAEELASGHAAPSSAISEPALDRDSALAVAENGGSARVDVEVAPKFRVGDRVRTKNDHPSGHTRLPRYVRGRVGEVISDHGVFIYADSHGNGRGADPQHLYRVRLSARELFGADAAPRDTVNVDLWDSHLSPE